MYSHIAKYHFFDIMSPMDNIPSAGINPLNLPTSFLVVLTIAMAWSIAWKGIALWKAARISHKRWFIILLVLNTVGILDIIYIYFIASKYRVETEEISNEAEAEEKDPETKE